MGLFCLTFFCGLLLWLPPHGNTQEPPAPHKPTRVVLILCDALTCDELHAPNLPQLSALTEGGAVGLMNCAVGSAKTPPSALLTIALSQQASALPFDETDTAAALKRFPNAPTLGALLAFASPSVRSVVCGSAQTDTPHRRAALLTADASGSIQGDLDLSEHDATAPFGIRDDIARLAEYAAMTDADLMVVQLGDTARVEAMRSRLTAAAYHTARAAALKRFDAFLYLLIARLDAEDQHPDVLIVSPCAPPDDARSTANGSRLTPLLAFGPDFPAGLFTSPTTRTPGLIANTDLAPTLLAHFGVPIPASMVGRPMRILTDSAQRTNGAERIALLRRMDYMTTLNRRATYGFMPLLAAVCFIVTLVGIAAHRKGGSRVSKRFVPALIFMLSLPTALLYAPLLVPPTLWEYCLRICGWMLALTAGSYLIAKFLRTSVPLAVALIGLLCVTIDILIGQPLLKFALFSDYPLSGIRYYGIGNEYLGIVLGFALLGGFIWLDDRRVPLPIVDLKIAELKKNSTNFVPGDSAETEFVSDPKASTGESSWRKITLTVLWLGLSFLLGWSGLGANAGSLIATCAGFGVGIAVLFSRRATVGFALACTLFGLLLTFVFGWLDNWIGSHSGAMGQGSSHAGMVLNAAQHGRGIGYLAEIALRKISLNLHLLFSPGLLAGAGIVAIAAWTAWLTIGSSVREVYEEHKWLRAGLPALLSMTLTSLVFKDSGVVTVAFLLGCAFLITLYFVFTETSPPSELKTERTGNPIH